MRSDHECPVRPVVLELIDRCSLVEFEFDWIQIDPQQHCGYEMVSTERRSEERLELIQWKRIVGIGSL